MASCVKAGKHPVREGIKKKTAVTADYELRFFVQVHAIEQNRFCCRSVCVQAFYRKICGKRFAVVCPPKTADQNPETSVRSDCRRGKRDVPRTIQSGLVAEICFLLRLQIVLNELRRNDAVFSNQKPTACIAWGSNHINEVSACWKNGTNTVAFDWQLCVAILACRICAYKLGAWRKDRARLPHRGSLLLW